MSEKYSEEFLQSVVRELVEELRECEDGTSVTTYSLIKESGYDFWEFDDNDLTDIHFSLLEAAKENHITIDMSAHEFRLEGLPYNLDYIVHNKNAQFKCPYCGSKNTARILYGMPVYNEKLKKKEEEGKIVFGGCCVHAGPANGGQAVDPDRMCNDCKKEFSTQIS